MSNSFKRQKMNESPSQSDSTSMTRVYSATERAACSLIQRASGHWLSMRSVNELNARANDLKQDTKSKPQPSQAEFDSKISSMCSSFAFRSLPPELWCEIYDYTPDMHDVLNMSLTCSLMDKVSQVHITWSPSVKYHFPKVPHSLSHTHTPFVLFIRYFSYLHMITVCMIGSEGARGSRDAL